jgi:hypothetical protein
MTKRHKKSIKTRRKQKFRNSRKKTLKNKKIRRGGYGAIYNPSDIYQAMMDFINAKNHGNINESGIIKNQLLTVLPTTDLTNVDGGLLMQLVIQSTDAEIRDNILNNQTLNLNEDDISSIRIYIDQLIDDDSEEDPSPETLFASETLNNIATRFPQLFPHLNQNIVS